MPSKEQKQQVAYHEKQIRALSHGEFCVWSTEFVERMLSVGVDLLKYIELADHREVLLTQKTEEHSTSNSDVKHYRRRYELLVEVIEDVLQGAVDYNVRRLLEPALKEVKK